MELEVALGSARAGVNDMLSDAEQSFPMDSFWKAMRHMASHNEDKISQGL